MNRKEKYLILIFYMFFYVYTPPVLPISTRHIIGIIAWIYLILNMKQIVVILKQKEFIIIVLGMVGLMAYLGVVAFINKNSLAVTSFYLYWLIDFIPGAVLIGHYTIKHQLKINYVFLIAAVIQSLFALGAYVSPFIHQIFLDIMASSGFYTKEFLDTVKGWRAYGFSSALFFDMPIIQSFLGIWILDYGIESKGKYILAGILLFLSAFINNRTSLVVLFIGIFMLIISLPDKKKIRKKYLRILMLILCLCLGLSMVFLTPVKESATIQWVLSGISELNPFAIKRRTIDTLLGDMIVFPDSWGIIIGHGLRIMGGSKKYLVNSDVGYINDIWMGGILYAAVKYMLFAYILWVIKKEIKEKRFGKQYFWFALGVLLVCNIKGQIFSPNCFTVHLMALFIYLLLGRSRKNEQKDNYISCNNI